MNEKETMEQCPNYNFCNAPICPLLNEQDLIWFPSDGLICKREDFQDLPFIKMQKKIKRLKKYSNNEVYTRKDLEKLFKEKNKTLKKETNFKAKKKISNHLKKFIP